MLTLWIATIGLFVALVALDLVVLNRRPRRVGVMESFGWTFFWLVMAGGFSAIVWLLHTRDAFGIAAATGLRPEEASLRFLAGFLIEIALDLDTVFLIAAVFTQLKIPERFQHHVLFYGLLLAIPVRMALVAGAGSLLVAFPWMRFAFAGVLILAALRMITIHQENTDPERNIFLRIVRRLFPVSSRINGADLLTRQEGKLAFTPLLVAVLLIESADAFLAFDSIVASLATTGVYTQTIGPEGPVRFIGSPYVIFTSNVLALLCLRSLYPALRELRGWIRYVKLGLALVLLYAAVTFALKPVHQVPIMITIGVVSSVLVAGFGLAGLFAKPGDASQVSPLGDDADRLAKLTIKQARRLVILVVGLTITAIGLFMAVGPGPGLLVIPIGLGLLATEFVWARRLLAQYAEKAKFASTAVAKRTPLWTIPLVVLGTIAGLVVAHVWWPKLQLKYLLPGALPMFVGQAIWIAMVIKRHRAAKAGGSSTPGNQAEGDQAPGSQPSGVSTPPAMSDAPPAASPPVSSPVPSSGGASSGGSAAGAGQRAEVSP
ncbi:MAG: PGPGW domain-containing protein [Planctomycetota bacterium]|nr:PGPGW domain-containing protein [Planctomycetota bacterium]